MAKLTSTAVGKRYARALFELTHPDHTDDSVLADLQAIQTVLSDNPDLLEALTSVNIAKSDKKQMLKTLTQDAAPLVQHLVDMVFENGRITDLPMIIKQYQHLVDEAEKRVTVHVTTAIALDDQQRERLRQKLMHILDANTIVLDEQIDPSIIGGVKIETHNRVLDGSLATKLAQIRQSIMS
ncbi:F-type H+-transporting ATPase subunit delta [Weissella uvarum]|uniref:ATP synthase F1 subunit delta n=1 Tax=Weissella uvarum TaxID=1479233 RepID=UPI0019612497|nr:ATP synthase F1 subunit delta [Weissella uvarum]MBM7616822.1 F-type H+-transporting ATPase subunit delta [Weissella uvarum]MCM0594726.1 F0F1 ATP synthase subunit delta [Weissella uvarum]